MTENVKAFVLRTYAHLIHLVAIGVAWMLERIYENLKNVLGTDLKSMDFDYLCSDIVKGMIEGEILLSLILGRVTASIGRSSCFFTAG